MNFRSESDYIRDIDAQTFYQGFGSAFFFADPDPGKNFDADPGEGAGGKGKNEFFF